MANKGAANKAAGYAQVHWPTSRLKIGALFVVARPLPFDRSTEWTRRARVFICVSLLTSTPKAPQPLINSEMFLWRSLSLLGSWKYWTRRQRRVSETQKPALE